jgi:hypothetical protein
VTFEDVLEIHLVVREKRTRSITYDFRFFSRQKLVAHGSLTAVCTMIDPASGHMASVPIPPRINEKIQAAPNHGGCPDGGTADSSQRSPVSRKEEGGMGNSHRLPLAERERGVPEDTP